MTSSQHGLQLQRQAQFRTRQGDRQAQRAWRRRPDLACAILAAAIFAGCSKKDAGSAAKPPPPAIPVDAGVVRLASVQRTVDVVGTLFGDEEATISNKVNGKVIAIYKDVGDRAEPGEPLAQLLRNDYLLSVNQKQASLAESLAKLGVEDCPTDDFEMSKLPAVRRAWLQRENAEAKFNRGKQLYDTKPPLISQQDFEDLQTSWNVAKSTYDVEIAAARGLIAEARTRAADLRVAEQALADTTVRAPQDKYQAPNLSPSTQPAARPVAKVDPSSAVASANADAGGASALAEPDRSTAPQSPRPATRAAAGQSGRYVVTQRKASIGELFPAVSPMFKLVKDDLLKLRAAVPERYFRDIAIGLQVTIRIDAYPDAFEGEVTRINPEVDQSNRTFSVEVTVPNPLHKLPPGAFARASIRTKMDMDVVFIPAQSVVSFAGINKVFLIGKDNKAQERQVTLGERAHGPNGEDAIEILPEPDGKPAVKVGDSIAVTGTSRLANGIAITVKPAK